MGLNVPLLLNKKTFSVFAWYFLYFVIIKILKFGQHFSCLVIQANEYLFMLKYNYLKKWLLNLAWYKNQTHIVLYHFITFYSSVCVFFWTLFWVINVQPPVIFLQDSACVLFGKKRIKSVSQSGVHTYTHARAAAVSASAAAASGNCIHVFGDEHRG